MVVSGLPVRIPDHAEQIATMALDLLHQSGRFKIKHLPEVPLQLRIGLHTGESSFEPFVAALTKETKQKIKTQITTTIESAKSKLNFEK